MPSKVIGLVAAAAALVLLPFSAGTALAEKRVALVIGNSAYQNVARLPNPLKDASAVAELFKKAGFDWVKMRQDVGNLEFKRALREFMDAAQDADMAVVYYAGHGIQVRDMNYMIPIDARLATEIDAEDEAVSLDRIVAALEPAKRLRLVILDACRDNPFARLMKRRVAMRAMSGGLAKMEPTLGDMLIAYAAKAGSTAEDGEGTNSPFAAALVKHLAVPGLDIRLAFGRVRDEVLRSTGNRQEPFVYGSLGGEAIALVPAPAQPKPAPVQDVQRDFDLIRQINTKRAWEIFIDTHKTGVHVELARDELKKLAMREEPPAAKPPRPVEPSSEERRAWDRIKETDDRAKLREFIEKYPASPLAELAKNRFTVLDRAAEERAEKARLEREAAQRREEESKRLKAEEARRIAAEREAAKQREEEAKRLQQEAKQREEEARRLKAEEAQRKAVAEREAARQREEEAKRLQQEARQREEDAKRLKNEEAQRKAAAEREAARQREQEEKRLQQEAKQREEDAARLQAEQAARLKAEEAARKLAEREIAKQREQDAQRTKSAEDARKQDEACGRDEDRLERLRGSLSQGWAREDLKRLERQTTCDRVRAQVVALLAQPTPDIVATAPPKPSANTPDLILAAQGELRRLGCFAGPEDGKLGDATTEAIKRYLSQKGRPAKDVSITDGLVTDLKDQGARVCPLTCGRGEHPEGDRCVANAKPEQPEKPEKKATARQRDEDQEAGRAKARREEAKREEARREREEAKRQQARREAARPKPEREAARPKPERAAARPAPQPAARSQASASPRPSGGGGGMIGVGF
jgi:peptidoglycan hydrolase-like protein with peptidoglycan-binding domain